MLLFPITGLAQGIQPIIGYNQGAGKKHRVRETLNKAYRIAAGYSIAAYGIVLCFAPIMLRMFTSENEVIDTGSTILKIVNTGLMFSGLQYIQSTYFQAIGKKLTSVLLALCNQVICFVPAVFVMSSLYKEKGIWLSFPVSAVLALIISSVFTVYTVKK